MKFAGTVPGLNTYRKQLPPKLLFVIYLSQKIPCCPKNCDPLRACVILLFISVI